jgi:general L-amino acid transport system substrate-binding protein
MIRRTNAPRLIGLLAVLALLASAACSDDDDSSDGGDSGGNGGEESAEGGLLAEVRDRGTLRCGVNDAVPGFGVIDDAGDFSGFDIEFCKVVATAVLGDPEAVEYTPLDAETRFTALQSREIDVLIRNTTFTASRDGSESGRFLATTFYDGQGMMVRADSGFGSVDDMDGTTICVLAGTTTELNLATRFDAAGLSYTPLTFPDPEQIQEAFVGEQCDGWTSDKSQLAGVRSAFPDAEGGPDSLVIFDDAFSKEPLGPVVRDGDDQWADAVNWAIIATIQAEEFDITTDNLDEMRESENPDILRFLGEPVSAGEDEDPAPFDPGIDLEPTFAADVIEQVGNYGEIYDRTVGPDTALGLDRGANAQWTDGGLLYAPPYR